MCRTMKAAATISRSRVAAVIIGFVVLVAPTLVLIEFSNGSENLVVATALEIRRDDAWLVPTLDGEPRLAKPPLTAWMVAAAIPSRVMEGFSNPNKEIREGAEWWLRWHARWPALLAAMATIGLTAVLASQLLGRKLSWIAAIVCASNLLFLRHSRLATTDLQLMLWVTAANCLLTLGLFSARGQKYLVLSGIPLGLAILSKGPVAIVQTLLPVMVYIAWSRWHAIRLPMLRGNPGSSYLPPILAAVAIALIVSVPWYIVVASRHALAWSTWSSEVTRDGARDAESSAVYKYLSLVGFLLPWSLCFVAGLFRVGIDARSRNARTSRHQRIMLAIALVIVPLVIMTMFRDRKDRYMLPMIVPAAAVCAYGLHGMRRRLGQFESINARLRTLQWSLIPLSGAGVAIAGYSIAESADGQPWFTPLLAGGVILITIVLASWSFRQRHDISRLCGATFLAMLVFQAFVMWGYRDSREGRSEMKPLADAIWQSHPAASLYVTHPAMKKKAPPDLSIYANRPVRWVESADEIVDETNQAILVMRQGKREAAPETPYGWRTLAKVQRDDTWWHALVRQSSE